MSTKRFFSQAGKQPSSGLRPSNTGYARGLVYASSIPYEACWNARNAHWDKPSYPGAAASFSSLPFLGKAITTSASLNPVQYANCPLVTANGNALSLAISFYPTTVAAGFGCLMSFGGDGAAAGWMISRDTAGIAFTIGGVADYTLLSSVLSANSPFTLVVTTLGNGTTATGYLFQHDTRVLTAGSAVAIGTITSPAAQPLTIGAGYNTVYDYAFAGSIGSFAVWDRTLTYAEAIQMAMNLPSLWENEETDFKANPVVVPTNRSFFNSCPMG